MRKCKTSLTSSSVTRGVTIATSTDHLAKLSGHTRLVFEQSNSLNETQMSSTCDWPFYLLPPREFTHLLTRNSFQCRHFHRILEVLSGVVLKVNQCKLSQSRHTDTQQKNKQTNKTIHLYVVQDWKVKLKTLHILNLLYEPPIPSLITSV